MLLSGALGLAIQTIATVVLARLLSPRDFGVVTMVTTFSLLLTNFGLNGFTEAVLQREEMNHFLASNLFWINVGAGLVLTAAFASAGSLLARFYKTPNVAQLAAVMSITIFLSSLSVIHLALLKRAMRFTALSVNDLVARCVAVTVSVATAWAGWGHWALAAGWIALPLSVSTGAWILCTWVPRLPRRTAGTSSMVRFAMNVYARFGTGYAAQNMDNLLIGWRFNTASLGAYKKAYDLFAMPANQLVTTVSIVAVSALSRLNRDRTEYKRYLVAILSLLAFVGMGLSGALTLVGRDLIRVLLGPKWEMSGWIFTFFAPGIGILLIYFTHVWIHISIGRPDRSLRWGFVEVFAIGSLFLVGLRWGPVGIASAWTASYWILTIPAFWYAGRPIGLRVSSLAAVIWRYVVASVVAGISSAAIEAKVAWLVTLRHSTGAFMGTLIGCVLFSTLYFGLVVLLHAGFSPIRESLKLLREMVPWGRGVSLPVATAEDAVETLSNPAEESCLVETGVKQ